MEKMTRRKCLWNTGQGGCSCWQRWIKPEEMSIILVNKTRERWARVRLTPVVSGRTSEQEKKREGSGSERKRMS